MSRKVKDNTVLFERKKIIDVLRMLESLVVSVDRIGSATAEMDRTIQDQVFGAFFDKWNGFRKLARMRTILSEPFSTELGPDDMDELEREMKGIRYWSASKEMPEYYGNAKRNDRLRTGAKKRAKKPDAAL